MIIFSDILNKDYWLKKKKMKTKDNNNTYCVGISFIPTATHILLPVPFSFYQNPLVPDNNKRKINKIINNCFRGKLIHILVSL